MMFSIRILTDLSYPSVLAFANFAPNIGLLVYMGDCIICFSATCGY